MTDVFSREKRSEIMSKIHQPTKLEDAVHEWLVREGVDHEMYPNVEGRPDVRVGEKYLFVDGCFWHCCPLHYRRPKSRQSFWIPHIEESNSRREARRASLPYEWLRVWEHEVGDGSFRAKVAGLLGGTKTQRLPKSWLMALRTS